ncbi:PP2C family protein-serine/threonine phosphatase [Isoptericola jiangsuensis]|uniref:PP2C family protein-serine/threonine phosphatase n=1 Tax=Isoptericola jiangsuensis TaxID=548579 RepID=UPI003AABE772
MPDWFDSALREGECASLAREVDWSQTPLGDPQTWPAPLRSAVELCFSTRFAVLVTWGPELTMIYNDGYRAMLGTDLHPRAMGAAAPELWAHIWEDIGPLFDEVVDTGRPTWSVDMLLWMDRSGFVEETRFTFSYSPLRDDDGTVRGVMDIATETTDQVVDRRRLATLGRLAGALHGHRDLTSDVARIAMDVLADSEDVSAAHLHLDGARTSTTGGDLAVAPEAVARVRRHGVPSWRDGVLVTRVGDGPEPGVLVLHGNPRRPYDDGQRAFLDLLARTIGTALSDAAEHRRRITSVRTVSDALQRAMVPVTLDSPHWQTRYRPADDNLAVGGDWFDVVELPGDRFGLVVGDCVGHGVGAAAAMGRLSSAGRALMMAGSGPAETLEQLDGFARTVPGAEFTTVFCGVVDTRTMTLTYSSAGHPPGLLVQADGTCSRLDEARCMPLTLPSGRRPEHKASLSAGDTVLMYTDGLVERRDESLAAGLDRLEDVARRVSLTTRLEDVPDRLLQGMLPDGARDDVALVVYRPA